MEKVDAELSSKKFISECAPAYVASVRAFLHDKVADRMQRLRKQHGMFEAAERQEEWDELTDLTMGASGE